MKTSKKHYEINMHKGVKMSISEMESVLGITEKEKIECPYQGNNGCDDCKIGSCPERCVELYEEWLEEQIA